VQNYLIWYNCGKWNNLKRDQSTERKLHLKFNINSL